MTNWTELPTCPAFDAGTRARLAALHPVQVPKGAALFHPGETAKGFVLVLEGRIEVYLTGATGREILLYAVEPGQSCVQTTLGLLGGEDYSGEAFAATDCRIVLIPKTQFSDLMNHSAGFRGFVFAAFGRRMQDMMQVLERVAFTRVECRLAAELLRMAEQGKVRATQADLATRIGSAREVVTRRLDQFADRGWVRTERGLVTLTDPAALNRMAAAGED